jgi:dTDP-4-amino-4,6-dideoxygalactose transaminase
MTAHRESAYNFEKYNLPLSEMYSDNSVVIPLFYPMKAEEVEKVITTIVKFLS